MSYRCEHGKDSDVCVQCWEEKNLEPIISMATPNTELQKAETRLRSIAPSVLSRTEWEYLEMVLSAAKQLQQIQQATGLCEKHQPNGGARRCVICSCESMHLALNKISYICGEPNEFEMSQFDDHGNEMEVVKQVEGLKSKLQQAEKERDELKAKAEELEGRIANALL